jgi:hypothetical protein
VDEGARIGDQRPEAGHSLSRCVINPRREQRAHCRRSLKPIFGCLRRNRREVFAAAMTRYLKSVYAAEPVTIGDFLLRQILGI